MHSATSENAKETNNRWGLDGMQFKTQRFLNPAFCIKNPCTLSSQQLRNIIGAGKGCSAAKEDKELAEILMIMRNHLYLLLWLVQWISF
jgi:hypothetical protein